MRAHVKKTALTKTHKEKKKQAKERNELTLKIVTLLYAEKYLKKNLHLKKLLALSLDVGWPIGRLLEGIMAYQAAKIPEEPEKPEKP
jgi:hypothetical protein